MGRKVAQASLPVLGARGSGLGLGLPSEALAKEGSQTEILSVNVAAMSNPDDEDRKSALDYLVD